MCWAERFSAQPNSKAWTEIPRLFHNTEIDKFPQEDKKHQMAVGHTGQKVVIYNNKDEDNRPQAGCSPEDLPEVMNDREKWRERVRDIRASGTTWWW